VSGSPTGPGESAPPGEDVFAGGEPVDWTEAGVGDGPLGAPPDVDVAGEPGTVQEAEEAFEVADAALADAEKQRDEYLDSLRRLQADFENYKKRVSKQQSDQLERANEGLVSKLLPVLDTADLALSHGGGEEVGQLRALLLDVLVKAGLERIDPEGGPFDPNLHDAVAHEPGDGEQEVAEVLRAGYGWNGRVLRPAMVKVRG
jgi:molecular chaperone GrpE